MSKIVNEDAFKAEVLDSDIPVLVDFFADWCGPCKMLGPVLEQLEGTYEGKFVLAKINVDDSPALAAEYGIASIPAVKLFVGGNVVAESVGNNVPAIRSMLAEFIK